MPYAAWLPPGQIIGGFFPIVPQLLPGLPPPGMSLVPVIDIEPEGINLALRALRKDWAWLLGPAPMVPSAARNPSSWSSLTAGFVPPSSAAASLWMSRGTKGFPFLITYWIADPKVITGPGQGIIDDILFREKQVRACSVNCQFVQDQAFLIIDQSLVKNEPAECPIHQKKYGLQLGFLVRSTEPIKLDRPRGTKPSLILSKPLSR